MKEYNYKQLAEYYDIMELSAYENYEKVNNFLDKLFKEYNVKSVLDMTCGTGAQTISLKKKGYDVVGSDISKDMLKFAESKSKELGIKYYHGDIRISIFGKFDAVIAIFNAIGHLSKKDFDKAVKNVNHNLKENGLFIFDIFNLEFMKKNFINYKFIDEASENNGKKFVRFNKNSLNYKNGIMKLNQETYIQDGLSKPKIYKEVWDMQLYSSNELKRLLEKNGFEVIGFFNSNREKLTDKDISIYSVARKR